MQIFWWRASGDLASCNLARIILEANISIYHRTGMPKPVSCDSLHLFHCSSLWMMIHSWRSLQSVSKKQTEAHRASKTEGIVCWKGSLSCFWDSGIDPFAACANIQVKLEEQLLLLKIICLQLQALKTKCQGESQGHLEAWALMALSKVAV